MKVKAYCLLKEILIIVILFIHKFDSKISENVSSKVTSDSVPVISFQPKKHFTSTFDDLEQDISDGFHATQDFTFCFRYKTQIISDTNMILETSQIKFGTGIKTAWIFLRPWNATTVNDEYRRVIKLCKLNKPGHWVSMCLRVKLKDNIQEIVFSQNEEVCFKQEFLGGSLGWIYFKKDMSIENILRYITNLKHCNEKFVLINFSLLFNC